MSESIDSLSPEAEVLFYRMIVQCDDYGRMDGRLSVIRSRCYPLRIDELSDDYISNLIHELLQKEMINIYTSENKNYIQIPSWEKHQQIRAKKSKYPEPETILSLEQAVDYYPYHMITSDINNNHNQEISDDNKCPRNPIQSNTNRNTNRNTIMEKISFSEDVINLTNLLIMLMKENDEQADIPDNINKWAVDIDKIIRLDKRLPEDVKMVIEFSQKDNFWKTNILSAKSLRRSFPKLYLKVKFGNNGYKNNQLGIEGNKPAGAFDKYEERDNQKNL